MFSHLSLQKLLFKLEESGDQVPLELIQTILSKGHEIVPPLCQILEDSRQYLTASDNRWWMPVHAVKLLGTLADPQALPQLVRTLIPAGELGIDWIMEDMPTDEISGLGGRNPSLFSISAIAACVFPSSSKAIARSTSST